MAGVTAGSTHILADGSVLHTLIAGDPDPAAGAAELRPLEDGGDRRLQVLHDPGRAGQGLAWGAGDPGTFPSTPSLTGGGGRVSWYFP